MRFCWYLLPTVLFASCQDNGSSEPLDIDYTLDRDSRYAFRRKPHPAASCPLDTAAILTNAHLDTLLATTSREELREYTSTRNIPIHILRYLDCVADGDFSIADPNAMWNGTCGHDDAFSDRKLAYLGIGPTMVLLTYYTGGIGVSKHAIIVKYTQNNVLDFWKGGVDDNAETKRQILTSIHQQQQQHDVLQRIAFARKYILKKSDTTVSALDKADFCRFYLKI